MVRHFFMLLTELVSNKREAFEGYGLHGSYLHSHEVTQMFRPIY